MKQVGCILTAGFLLALSGCDSAPEGNGAHGNASTRPLIEVDAGELALAFQHKGAKALLAYEGAALKVTGRVKNVEPDITNEPVIELSGADNAGDRPDEKAPSVSIHGFGNETASQLDLGQPFSVVCQKIEEATHSAQLSNCVAVFVH